MGTKSLDYTWETVNAKTKVDVDAGTSYSNGDYVANGFMKTADGGIAVQMINKTGAASVKGDVISANSVDNGFDLITVDVPDPIGVVYEAGVADGELCWVVITGKAKVNFIGNTTAGHFARGFLTADVGYVIGKALSEAVPVSPFATDKHFYEIGHVLESRVGAGLALVNLHFN